jgi:hypothetical protein
MSRVREAATQIIEDAIKGGDGRTTATMLRKRFNVAGFPTADNHGVCRLAVTLGFLVHGRIIVKGAK